MGAVYFVYVTGKSFIMPLFLDQRFPYHIYVSGVARSRALYTACLSTLGWRLLVGTEARTEDVAMFVSETDHDGIGIYLLPKSLTDDAEASRVQPLYSFHAGSLEAVKDFHTAAMRNGGTSSIEPGPDPTHCVHCAAVTDLDGNTLMAWVWLSADSKRRYLAQINRLPQTPRDPPCDPPSTHIPQRSDSRSRQPHSSLGKTARAGLLSFMFTACGGFLLRVGPDIVSDLLNTQGRTGNRRREREGQHHQRSLHRDNSTYDHASRSRKRTQDPESSDFASSGTAPNRRREEDSSSNRAFGRDASAERDHRRPFVRAVPVERESYFEDRRRSSDGAVPAERVPRHQDQGDPYWDSRYAADEPSRLPRSFVDHRQTQSQTYWAPPRQASEAPTYTRRPHSPTTRSQRRETFSSYPPSAYHHQPRFAEQSRRASDSDRPAWVYPQSFSNRQTQWQQPSRAQAHEYEDDYTWNERDDYRRRRE